MPNRTAKFVPAITASLLAGVPLATASYSAAQAADNCVASPKEQAPSGSHWYYRVEHPSNRHCWYVRGQHDAVTQTAPPNASVDASPSANPASPNPSQNNSVTMPGSVANARAELTSPQAGGNQRSSAATGPSPAATTAGADATAGASRADANMLRSVVGSRWPEQLAAASSIAPDANSDHSSATAPSATPIVPLVAADAAGEKQSSSIQMLIFAIVGALSVAGLAASAVGYGGRRKHRLDEIEVEDRSERRAIWETTLPDRPLPSPFAASAAIRPNIGIPRELREADDTDDKIAEMLARLARSASV